MSAEEQSSSLNVSTDSPLDVVVGAMHVRRRSQSSGGPGTPSKRQSSARRTPVFKATRNLPRPEGDPQASPSSSPSTPALADFRGPSSSVLQVGQPSVLEPEFGNVQPTAHQALDMHDERIQVAIMGIDPNEYGRLVAESRRMLSHPRPGHSSLKVYRKRFTNRHVVTSTT